MKYLIALIVIVVIFGLAILWLLARKDDNGIELGQNSLASTDTIGVHLPINVFFDVKTLANAGTVLYLKSYGFGDNASYASLVLEIVEGKLTVTIRSFPAGASTAQLQHATTTTRISDGKFHAIGVFVTPTRCTILVDGVLDTNKTLNVYVPIEPSEATFGGNGFVGFIRNVKFQHVPKKLVIAS